MKLDNQTITILQNFQTINPSIVINQGNVLKTIAPSQSVFAKATVANTFPLQFGIYDIGRFLAVLSLLKDYDIDFQQQHMNIHAGKSKIRYSYCNPTLIVTPPDKPISFPTNDVVFDLPQQTLQNVMRAMQILGFNEIEVTGEDGELSISAVNIKNNSTDVFSTVVGNTDKNFSAVIEADKLKLIPSDYRVTVCSKGIVHFACDQVEYWIALSAKSKF